MMPFVMLATYSSIYLILPYYLKKRKLILSLIAEILVLFISTLAERIFMRNLYSLEITLDSLFSLSFLYLLMETNFMVAVAVAIKILKKLFDQQEEKHDLEKRNLKTELNLLKAQLHPHFLFNTMNNLYALSVEKSSRTSEGIAKISNLLRCVLYDCNDLEVPLQQEIKLIENYIDLEKLRYGDRLNMNFEVKGEINNIKIAPMLLFTFVENCFKHGSSNDPEVPYIRILLNIFNNNIEFIAENSKPHSIKRVKRITGGGIGLQNVKKRLEIIYRNNFELNIQNLTNSFRVSLNIRNE